MKTFCVSCIFFISYKPVTPGAVKNSECLRTPGYYRSPVMNTCEFYEKKGKKVAKKEGKSSKKDINNETFTCSGCGWLIGKITEGKHWFLEGSKEPLCEMCYKNETIPKEKKDTEEKKDTHERFLVIESLTSCMGIIPSIYTYIFKTKEGAIKYINKHNLEYTSFHLSKVTSESSMAFSDIRLNLKIEEGVTETVQEVKSYE